MLENLESKKREVLLAIYISLYYNSFQNDGVLKKGRIVLFIKNIVFLLWFIHNIFSHDVYSGKI